MNKEGQKCNNCSNKKYCIIYETYIKREHTCVNYRREDSKK